MAAHSSILAWRIPWTEEPDRATVHGSQRVGHNSETNTVTFTKNRGIPWRRGKNTRVRCHFLLQRIFSTQGLSTVSYISCIGRQVLLPLAPPGKLLPTRVFFPGESYGQRSLVGYSPWGRKRVGHDRVTNIFTVTLFHKEYILIIRNIIYTL